MKPTDFAYYLTKFLSVYMPVEFGASRNTIASYRDSYTLFLVYMRDCYNILAEQLRLDDIKKEHIEGFLDWVEVVRKCSADTRNVRLTAMHSFFKFLQLENPDNINHIDEWQRILQIPAKRTEKKAISYMSVDGIKLLLEQPNKANAAGRRDLAILSLMYDTAASVQEIIDLTPCMIRTIKPCTVKLNNKGGKERIVPLMDSQAQILIGYMEERRLLEPQVNRQPLFFNNRHKKLTRAGVSYILDKYVEMARQKEPVLIPERFSCYCLRHSRSIHLIQDGVSPAYLCKLLGHSSIRKAEAYASIDTKQKSGVKKRIYDNINPHKDTEWTEEQPLLEWLKSVGSK